MAVKILIKRRMPVDKISELMPYLKQLRNLANSQPGYISGETLKSVDQPGRYLVISNWQSMEDWKKWVVDADRVAIQTKIDMITGEKTEYEVFTYA